MKSFVVGAALLALVIPQVGSSADTDYDKARSYIPPPADLASQFTCDDFRALTR